MRGFHLLDLLVVLVLVGTVTGTASYGIQNWISLQKVIQELEVIELFAESFHLTAQQTKKSHRLELADNSLIARATDLPEIELERYTPKDDISVSIQSTTPGRITFHNSGTVTPGRITLRGQHTACELIISLRGRMRKQCS